MNKKLDCVRKMESRFDTVNLSLIKRAFKDNLDKWVELSICKDKNSFPIYKYLFCPKDDMLINWIKNHIVEINIIGFRIFQDKQDNVIYLGIDKKSNIESYWIKLYDLIGFKWDKK